MEAARVGPGDVAANGSRRAPGRRRPEAPTPSRPSPSAFRPAEQRLLRLMAELRRRQRRRPDLAVRPWWTLGRAEPGAGSSDGASARGDGLPTVGFTVEYCPNGDASAELQIRTDRVTVEGPSGFRDVPLDLRTGWVIGGESAGAPELLANRLLRLADEVL